VTREFKVLLVEDDEEFAKHIIQLLMDICERIEITLVRSRDEARSVLSDEDVFFDFISLDLTIPIQDNGFDIAPENGLAVLGFCRELSPGTPILVLTGSSTVQMMSGFLSSSYNIDVWSEGVTRPTIDHLPKESIDQFVPRVTQIYEAVRSLSDIELVYSSLEIPIEHDRLLRIFIKEQVGVIAEIEIIGGGLSAATVYSVKISNDTGNAFLRAVAKCGSFEDIQKDANNYDRIICRLRPEVTPRKLKHLQFGAKANAGVFYGLAVGYDLSFFKAAISSQLTSEIRTEVQGLTSSWKEAGSQKRVSINEIRKSLLTDKIANALILKYNLDWAEEFERLELQSNVSFYHGDLHGENILVDVDRRLATLIDYGDISYGSCTIDSVTLECSFLFHPNGPDLGDWPTNDQIENWANLDGFVKGSPVKNEIRFCREWSDEVKAGNRELAACLYSYALRQLKYPKTNKELALGLIHSAKKLYESS
jgi:CheY-like chemotaxis protein